MLKEWLELILDIEFFLHNRRRKGLYITKQDIQAIYLMELSIKQTTALDLLEDTRTNEVLFGGGAG